MNATKSLQEVWDMKQAAYEETKDLRGRSYFAHVHRRVDELLPACTKLRRLAGAPRSAMPIAKVAEAPAKYPAKRKK